MTIITIIGNCIKGNDYTKPIKTNPFCLAWTPILQLSLVSQVGFPSFLKNVPAMLSHAYLFANDIHLLRAARYVDNS